MNGANRHQLNRRIFGESATVCVMPRVVRGPAKPQQRPPHEFVLETLTPLKPEVRRMLSGFGMYVGDRIVFMLHDHEKSPRD